MPSTPWPQPACSGMYSWLPHICSVSQPSNNSLIPKHPMFITWMIIISLFHFLFLALFISINYLNQLSAVISIFQNPTDSWRLSINTLSSKLSLITSTNTITVPLRLEVTWYLLQSLVFLVDFPLPPLRFNAHWKVKPGLLHPYNPQCLA